MFSLAPSHSVFARRGGEAEMERPGDPAQHTHPQIDLGHARSTEACRLIADLIDQRACDRHLMHGRAPLLPPATCALGRVDQPIDPAHHAFAGPGRDLQHGDVRIDRPRMLDAAADIEVEMRQEIDLGQDHHARGGKGVRIFQRLVVSLGHREDRDFVRLAEIEAGRANQVADILDEQDRIALERQARRARGRPYARRGDSRARC